MINISLSQNVYFLLLTGLILCVMGVGVSDSRFVTLVTMLTRLTVTPLLELTVTVTQCSKLRVHPAPGVHILAAGGTHFDTSASGGTVYA